MSVISREDLVEGSVIEYARAALLARGFPQEDWKIIESFPYSMERLDVNTIAVGFSFDDGGHQAELGSNLKARAHTIEFFVFGKTNTYARSLANALKYAMEQDQIIPLRDVTNRPTMPQIDVLQLDAVHSHRQVIPDPEPWSEFTWVTTVKVTDTYYANLA